MNLRVLWLLPSLAWSGIAASAPPVEALNEYREAASRFSSLIAEAEAGNKVLQLESPEFKELIEILSDERTMLVADTDPKDGIETDLDICGIANKAVSSLALFDLKERVTKTEDQQELMSDFNAMMNRNLLMFQDELKELQPFLFRCMARLVPKLERLLASLGPEQLTDIRRGGLAEMREGILMIFQGGLAAASDTTLREDYRSALLSVLAETAEAYASVMNLPERKKIAQSMKSAILPADDRNKPHLILIARAFLSEECSVICEIQ